MKNEHVLHTDGKFRVIKDGEYFFVLHVSQSKKENMWRYSCLNSAIAHCAHLAYVTPCRDELFDEIKRLKSIIAEQDERLMKYAQIASKHIKGDIA